MKTGHRAPQCRLATAALAVACASAPAAYSQVATDEAQPIASAAPAVGASKAQAPQGTPPVSLSLGSLPAGKSLTIVYRATVNAGPFAAGKNNLSNQGTVSGSNFASIPTNDPDTGAPNDPTLTPLDAAPDLSLTKSDGGASVSPGGTVAYALTYGNNGTQGASGVVLTETVPANTTFNAGASTAGWACAPNNNAGSVCTLALGSLAVGGGSTATFAVTVVNPVAAGVTLISNTASIGDGGANGPDPTPVNNVATDTTPLTADPDLALTKTDGGATVAPGGTVSYTLGYSNVGNQGASGIVLTETVPANATFNPGASSAGWVCAPNNNAGSTCTLAIGALNGGGASGTATFALTVVNPVAAGVTQISNTASVADDGANGTDPNGGNNSASDTTPLSGAPDLTLAKADGGVSVAPGGTVVYTLNYSNAGNRGASGVVLTETVPANTAFNPGASTAAWVCLPNNNAGSLCTLPVGALAGAGASGSATFAVTVVNPVPAGATQISNTASVADDGTNGTDPVPGNNSSSDTTPLTGAPDLALTKSDGGASVAPGGTVTYTLGITNNGNRGAAGVLLSETVPAHTTFNAGASSAGWACLPDNNAGSTCTLAVGTLAGGGATSPATFAVTVVNPVPAGVTQISNTASVADNGANGTDPTPGDSSASDTTPIVAAPDLALTKSDGGASVAPGGTASYTLSYSNVGDRGATGVVLTETVPAETTFNAGASTAGWVCVPDNNAGSTCTLAIGAVAAGSGTLTATFAVTVVNPVPAGVDSISNTATIGDDGANGTDPVTANNSGSDTTPVTATPDLTLTKSDGGASVTVNGTVTYALGYANAGTQGATGVVLTETVPANTTFNAGASTPGWACTPNGNAGSTCTLAVGGLAGGGANASANFAVTVNATVPGGTTQISNTASVADDAANGTDPTPGNNSASDTTPLITAPDLRVTKTDNRNVILPGQVTTYTITVDNMGSSDTAGVVLTETVPANTTYVAAGSSAWSCPDGSPAPTSCTISVGSLVAGGPAQTFTFVVKLIDPTPTNTLISNTASAADNGAAGADSNLANNSATDTTRLSPRGDFNANGTADILFQNTSSERLVVWFMNGLNQTGGNFTSPLQPSEAGFKAVATADFDVDGRVDILFRNASDGRLRVWTMNGMSQLADLPTSPALNADLNWRVVASGDFNSDGRADILWRHELSGNVVVWLMNGLTRTSGQFTTPTGVSDTGWRIVGAGQFNLGPGPVYDLQTDILWRNNVSGNLVVWLMNGLVRTTGMFTNPPSVVDSTWEVVAVADYNGDNQADILWRNKTSGRLVMWFMDGVTRTLGAFTSPDSVPGSPGETGLSWFPVGPK